MSAAKYCPRPGTCGTTCSISRRGRKTNCLTNVGHSSSTKRAWSKVRRPPVNRREQPHQRQLRRQPTPKQTHNFPLVLDCCSETNRCQWKTRIHHRSSSAYGGPVRPICLPVVRGDATFRGRRIPTFAFAQRRISSACERFLRFPGGIVRRGFRVSWRAVASASPVPG